MSESTSSSRAPIENLFAFLWEDYLKITPQARQVHALLEGRGEKVINDHIALRTFDYRELGVNVLAQPFLEAGYVESGHYDFAEKKLNAKSFSHPSGNLPRVFISELRLAEVDDPARTLIDSLTKRTRTQNLSGEELLRTRPSWPLIGFADYEMLRTRSEYAAWLAVMGLRANHFTVSVNALDSFRGLEELNATLLEAGFQLNGESPHIQGNPSVLLEQSSTVADEITWGFRDGTHLVRSCYYEFAKRYKDPNTGELYDGFVTQSADKIFESTDR